MRFLVPVLCAILTWLDGARGADSPPAKLSLLARTRVETKPGSGLHRVAIQPLELEPAKCAAVVCDMWDVHWCQGASRRVADMAPRMNAVLKELRRRGVLIIHCPSSTLEAYKDTPQRKLAQAAPKVEPKVALQSWCRIDQAREGALPIDDADGGCDCQPQCPTGSPWKRQIAAIEIGEGDAITDSAEAYYLMRQRGIESVLVLGVHTNMCVLGRPFSIRQLRYQGLNVVLVRDMTDTMYNSRRWPFVPHGSGTDLVVEHIEKHWCPTISSDQIVGGAPFRFRDDTRKVLAAVISEDEYDTDATLPRFADRWLLRAFDVRYALKAPGDKDAFVGLEALGLADVALLSVWRRTPPAAQMEMVRKYVAAGKPLVAIRTSCHAFQRRAGWELAAGHAEWPAFDEEVLGAKYTGHHGNQPGSDVRTRVWIAPGTAEHPILRGFPAGEQLVASWLYKLQPLSSRAVPLLLGRAGDRKPEEPVAWTSTTAAGGRVFFTSLGHTEDLQMPAIERLVSNGIHWTANVDGQAEPSLPAPVAAGGSR